MPRKLDCENSIINFVYILKFKFHFMKKRNVVDLRIQNVIRCKPF